MEKGADMMKKKKEKEEKNLSYTRGSSISGVSRIENLSLGTNTTARRNGFLAGIQRNILPDPQLSNKS